MLQHDWTFIDTETTGLDPKKHEIIEIGCVRASWRPDLFGALSLTIIGEQEWKIIPEHIELAEPRALEVNGYNTRDWSDAKDARTVMEEFVQFAHDSVFVAQNVTFDWSFILATAHRVGVPIERTFFYNKLDLGSIALGKLYKQRVLERYTLRHLAGYFGVDNAQAHTALSDARTGMNICKKLLDE